MHDPQSAGVGAAAPSSSRMLASYLTDIEQLLDEQRWDAALREACDLPRIAVALSDPQLRCSGDEVGMWCRQWIPPLPDAPDAAACEPAGTAASRQAPPSAGSEVRSHPRAAPPAAAAPRAHAAAGLHRHGHEDLDPRANRSRSRPGAPWSRRRTALVCAQRLPRSDRADQPRAPRRPALTPRRIAARGRLVQTGLRRFMGTSSWPP